MRQIVVLLEEESARIVAENLAGRIGISEQMVALVHQGKQDLERSIANKLSRWRSFPPPRFIVVVDNDRASCKTRKQQLLNLVPDASRERTRVRIVMQELEAWYFGDISALEAAGIIPAGQAAKIARKARYRDVDAIQHPKRELKRLLDTARMASPGQIALARAIAPHLSLTENNSKSFKHFIAALDWAAGP